jgi:hypothetical protein
MSVQPASSDKHTSSLLMSLTWRLNLTERDAQHRDQRSARLHGAQFFSMTCLAMMRGTAQGRMLRPQPPSQVSGHRFQHSTAELFTGSNNFSLSGEEGNGVHLIMIEDCKVATAYANEAMRVFDHLLFKTKCETYSVRKIKPLQGDRVESHRREKAGSHQWPDAVVQGFLDARNPSIARPSSLFDLTR